MGLKNHIAFVCSRLDLPGGIERAIVNTANLFQRNGHQVTLLVLDETTDSFYPLDKRIAIIRKNLHFGITENGNLVTRKLDFVQDVYALKRLIKKVGADVIIGTEYQFSIAAFLSAKSSRMKVFAWEHHHFYWLKRSFFWQWLFKKVYPKLDGVICLNAIEKRHFEGIGCRSLVIPNFIEKNEKAAIGAKSMLSVGWLIKRKGVDMIPAIAEKVFAKYPDWNWKIIGSGPEEESLKKEIHEKKLTTNVYLIPPASPDLSSFYLDTSIYVMTSRFECFPMVLLEAMSHGIPCISFDCPTGPSSIIKHNVDGLLVKENDIDQIAESIIQLITDEEKRIALGKNAYQNIDRFSPENVYALWEKLLHS